MELNDFLLFLSASILLNIAPGPDMVYIVSRSIAQGRKAGFFSSFGVCTGALVHVIASALGLSAILATSAMAFTIVKWIGAIYLIYLGLQALLSKNSSMFLNTEGIKKQNEWAIFRQGMLIDILNPKVAIFFLAFLPQFIDPSSQYRTFQIFMLGFLVILIALIWEFILVYFATKITITLRRNAWISNGLNKTMGLIFIALGLRLATEKV